MKKNIKNRIPGVLILLLLAIAMVLFMAILIKIKLLPTKMLLLAGGVFLLYAVCVFLLTRNSQRVGAMICGCMMTMLLLIALMLGTPYLTRAVDTLGNITSVDVEIADMGVYVEADSAMSQLSDLTDGSVGILETLDRENTEEALADVEDKIGTLQVQNYTGVKELVDGLLHNEVDAILINSAYLDLLTDVEGYTDTVSQLRKIYEYQAQTSIDIVDKKDPANDWDVQDLFGQGEKENTDRVFTMYISGIDSRSGLIAKSNSDVNILATVNVDTRQVLLISTPRDFYVPLPISNGIPDKLTHAGIYGIDVSVGTLEMLYDTEIDYYFRVNFSGFERIIDALGGVTVHSDYAFSVDGYSYSKGENFLNGAEALRFARERKSFSTGDRQRGKNQMEVIKAVIEKAMSPAILTGYMDIMEIVSGSFETSMPYDLIAELVRDQLDKGGSWNVVSCSVDGSDGNKIPYSMSTSAYVMIPDQSTVDAAIAKIQQVKNGEILN